MASWKDHLRTMRFGLDEVSGALGDLGTFVPLVASLIAVCGMDGASVLVFAGVVNVAAGVAFNQPVPVQPMKAIAAVAIAEGLAPGEIAAAGLATGAVVLVLGLSGLSSAFEKIIPRPVVRGIQLGVGLKLAAKGLGMTLGLEWLALDSRLVAIAAACVVLSTSRMRRFPSALVLFVGGLVLLAFSPASLELGASLGWSGPQWIWPSVAEWQTGIWRGAVPQLPLTLLNSVIAVCALSGDLFPARRISARAMSISVGLANLLCCPLGAMPSCHGSGGLAGQYRFGARTGGSVVMLGVTKIALGVVFGAAIGPILAAYPLSVLGVLLVFAGIELSLAARDAAGRDAFFVAAITAMGILATNTALGFALGFASAALLLRPFRSS